MKMIRNSLSALCWASLESNIVIHLKGKKKVAIHNRKLTHIQVMGIYIISKRIVDARVCILAKKKD